MLSIRHAARAELMRTPFTRSMVPVPKLCTERTDSALSAKEIHNFRRIMDNLSDQQPDVCRELIFNVHNAADNIVSTSVCVKIQRQYGRGKTQFFTYLSAVDKERILELTEADGVDEVMRTGKGKTTFFAQLPNEVKYNSLRKWQKEREQSRFFDIDTDSTPPIQELWRYGLSQGVPMVGFGFVDNFFMISFGGAIDSFFGLYVTTLVAAGLGNLCSNIIGLGAADRIESLSGKLGIPQARLSESQRAMSSVRVAGLTGIISGVTIGCLLGLLPAMYLPDKAENAGETQTSATLNDSI